MKILALDTSTKTMCVGISDGQKAWEHDVEYATGLSCCCVPAVGRILAALGWKASDVDLFACGLGPGSFTGIRIGLATALGIAHARGIPLVGVSTLDAIARSWEGHDGDVYPVIDARKGKIYSARFQGGVRQGDYLDGTPADLAAMIARGRRPLIAGPDAERIRGMLGEAAREVPCGTALDPLSLLRSGVEKYTNEGADPDSLRPLYLRKSEAEIASGL